MLATTSRERALGVSLVATGALGFSTTAIFARQIEGVAPLGIAGFRALICCVAFGLLCVLQRKRLPQRLGDWGWLTGLGLAVGATGMLYIYAVRHTTVANAVLLNNTSTVYVALIAPWLLREPRPRYTWLSLALALTGIACLTDPRALSLEPNPGLIAATLSGFTYALTMLFSRHLRDRVDGLVQIGWSTGVAALLALPWTLLIPAPALIHNWPWLIAVGLIGQGLPYYLYFQGLRRVNAQVVSAVALLEPVSGILIGLLLYRETPTPVGIIGIVLVLLSILLVSVD